MYNLKLPAFIITVLVFASFIKAQVTYQGPAQGWVPGGVMISTDSFGRIADPGDTGPQFVKNLYLPDEEPMVVESPIPSVKSVYVEDPNINGQRGGSGQTVLLQDFAGIGMTNSIPPDPHIAVGPNHVIACVNSRFAIWDKQGNLLKNISANAWYVSVLGSPGPFDPQVIYDHYAGRWFMLWDSQNDNPQRAHFLISVSDDDNPLGIWYNYALPADRNGMTVVSNWGDFPQIGFDEEAIYINSRQFTFTGFKVYDKIRILNKSQLYAADGDSVYWTDIWDITYPHSTGRPDIIRPVIPYTPSSKFYFVHTLRTGGNLMAIYWITNPLTTPVLSGDTLMIGFYGGAPNANQLGGGTPLIDANGSSQKNASIFRDGFIWVVHSIQNPASPSSAALRYYKIDPETKDVHENVTFGAANHWYIFPAIAVDKDQNIAITYSRSSLTEYIGAFYSTRLASDPPGLNGSTPLREGQGNYVVTFGSGRNRWGDYLGIYLDPVTEYNVWMLPEFAAATNTWGTWIGEIRMVPFPGTYGFTSTDELNFGSIEINFTSSPLSLIISNYGEDDLVINNIPASTGPFNLLTNLNFPVTLSSYDSLTIELEFAPVTPAIYEETLTIQTNQTGFADITLRGRGFQINPADYNVLYASSGANNNGEMLTVDIGTGNGTLIGPSLFSEVKSIAIHPQTKVMYGIVTSLNESQIVRVNAQDGDSYNLFTIPLGNFAGIAFDTSGVLYGMIRTGELYTIDIDNETTTMIGSAGVNISGIAFNHATNELWASALIVVGANRDRIYKIDTNTGDATIIGNTGFNLVNNDIVFDNAGHLYAVIGSTSQDNDLISIDTASAAGTFIGSVGFPNITGLAYLPDMLTFAGDDESSNIPTEFALSQNYPNPFNPVTTIEFSLPVASAVKITVYNILGEVVNELVNKQLAAGYHRTDWSSSNKSGSQVGSGVYFYEIKAKGNDGREFSQFRKMILLK